MRVFKRIIVPLFLLAMFVSYQAGITMFCHMHYVDGVVIVHSHPSKDKNHTHTKTQLLVLGQLSHFQAETPNVVSFIDFKPHVFYYLEPATKSLTVEDIHLKNVLLRAPPCIG